MATILGDPPDPGIMEMEVVTLSEPKASPWQKKLRETSLQKANTGVVWKGVDSSKMNDQMDGLVNNNDDNNQHGQRPARDTTDDGFIPVSKKDTLSTKQHGQPYRKVP